MTVADMKVSCRLPRRACFRNDGIAEEAGEAGEAEEEMGIAIRYFGAEGLRRKEGRQAGLTQSVRTS